MKKVIGILFAFTLFLNFNYEAAASHVSGGSIKYTYLGPGTVAGTHRYKVVLGVYRDCNGMRYTTTSERITAVCMPGRTPLIVQTAPKVNYIPKAGERPANLGAKDVSDVCRNKATKCLNRTNPGGYEVSFYETIFQLPACDYWEIYMSPSQCCRNGTTNMNGSYFAPVTRLASRSFPKNNSPIFADEVKPFPSVCTGQDVFYGIGTFDPDGDSLRFIFDGAIDRINSPGNYTYVRYNGGFSAAIPIPGIKLDSTTGLISFKTTRTGKYLVAFWVIEYERCTGKEVGRTHREVQFDVRSCSNNVPRDISGVSNLIGNVKKTGRYKMEVCQGEKFSWEDTIFDKDATDTLRFESNMGAGVGLPGMTMTKTFLSRNKAVLKFEWTAVIGKNPIKSFFISFDDDRCDFPGNGFSVFELSVLNATSAGPDIIVCQGDSADLTAYGGVLYNWRTISGDPLVVGVNWFPDTTATDTNRTGKFKPRTPTILEVKSDLKFGCIRALNCRKLDTVYINPVDSFQLTTVPDFFLCNPGKGKLDATPSRSTMGYSYKWNNSSLLTNDTLKNPNFSSVKFPTRFTVTVTGDSGCVRETFVDVNVTDPFPTNMKAMISDTLVCLSKQIQLWVDKGSIDYNGCDTVTYRCQGIYKDYTLGSGTQPSPGGRLNTMPLTYGSYNYSQRSQYLYLASELRKLGMKPGPVKSIAWEIKSLYARTAAPFNKFTIKIACTKIGDLPKTGFVSGLKQVYNPKSILPGVGWNVHNFDNEYVWDGVSNLIVEVCWENGNSRLNGHHVQSFDNKTYRAANSYYQDYTFRDAACGNSVLSPGFPTSMLPRTRFNSCTGMRNSLFKFTWNPTSNGGFIGASNTDSVDARVNLSTAKKYTVYIEDSAFGVCKDTLEVNINVVSSYDAQPVKLRPQCQKTGFIQLLAKTPWNITRPGGRWSGKGVVNDTLGIWDPSLSGLGKFWVKYKITGDACAAADSVEIEIVGLPDPSLLSPDSLCGIYGFDKLGLPDTIRHRLIPKNPGGWFTGIGVDSVLNKNTNKMVYFVNGKRFNPTTGKPDTAFITYTLLDGCLTDSLFKIPVVAPWDHSYLGVMDHGKPYPTVSFCASSSEFDTLVVAGPNPVWQYLNYVPAMVDRNVGALDARLASFNRDTLGSIKVGNYGFCGTDTTILVQFVKAPQIEVIPRFYCDEEVKDPANFARIDTVLFRIPKGPIFPGSTGKKTLDPNGFDPNTEVTISYGSIANSGWPQAIDQVSNQYSYNFWNGDPWMKLPNVARYRMFAIPTGSNWIKYQFAIRYRSNFPSKFWCASLDSAEIIKVPEIPAPKGVNLNFCEADEVGGFMVDSTSGIDNRFSVIWYYDNTGSLIDTLEIGEPLTNKASMNAGSGEHVLYARYLNKVTGCKSGKIGEFPYKVFEYPEVSFNTNPEGDTVFKIVPANITYMNNSNYTSSPMTYQWRTKCGEYSGASSNMIDNRSIKYTSNNELMEFPVRYDSDCQIAGITLWGVNEVGCADSTTWLFEIGTAVEFQFPNVFTPGKDGANDWWFILPPGGSEDYGCSPNCYTLEGEASIKDWYESNLEEFSGTIYDRWGRKVYEITKSDPVWKGENKNGTVQTDGVYMYALRWKAKGSRAKEASKEGTITLIREK